MSTNAEVLRSVPLFQGMSDRSVETIAGLAFETDFPEGAALVREGEPGDRFLIIRNGSAVVDQGGRTLRHLGAGDFVGEISLIDGSPRSATVTATAPVAALCIDRDGFTRLMDEFPSIRHDLLNALTQRVRTNPDPGALD
jgi:CRP/FNR family transcriptional regulator, cyclic AMP receptor protein